MSVGPALRWSRQLLGALGNDLRGVRAALRGRRMPAAGLYTYKFESRIGKRRLHLRVAADRSAVLLVDVTDAIQLNPAAAFLAYRSLEHTPIEQAATALRGLFRRVSRNEARRQAERIYGLVEHLSTTTDACTTCGLQEIERASPFSTPVSAPLKADLALTYGCNNACSHCYNGDRRQQPPQCGSTLTIPQWREVLARLAAIGVPHVIFTGGEPTLFDGLDELIREANALGLVAGVNTNGRRLADARFAASLATAELDHVQITLESHDPAIHNAMTCADSFIETLAGIQNSLAVGLHTLTNTTLTRQNIDHAGKMVGFLHAMGLRTFAMNAMIHAGRGRAHGDALPAQSLAPALADIREQAARRNMRFLWYTPTQYCRLSPQALELGPRRCNAGEYSMCIEPNGDVLPCQSYYVPAGNLLRDPWEQIWQSALFLSFRRRTSDPVGCGLPERCQTCPDLPICAGGCRLERESERDG